MKFLRPLLLLASAATAIVTPRDFPGANLSVSRLITSAMNFTSVQNNVKGAGLAPYIPVIVYGNYLQGNFSDSRTAFLNSAGFTGAQSSALLRQINGTLYPSLRIALNTLVGKKANYTRVGLGTYEASVLSSLNVTALSWATAVVQKVPAPQTAVARSVSSSFSALLVSASSAYAAAPTS